MVRDAHAQVVVVLLLMAGFLCVNADAIARSCLPLTPPVVHDPVAHGHADRHRLDAHCLVVRPVVRDVYPSIVRAVAIMSPSAQMHAPDCVIVWAIERHRN